MYLPPTLYVNDIMAKYTSMFIYGNARIVAAATINFVSRAIIHYVILMS